MYHGTNVQFILKELKFSNRVKFTENSITYSITYTFSWKHKRQRNFSFHFASKVLYLMCVKYCIFYEKAKDHNLNTFFIVKLRQKRKKIICYWFLFFFSSFCAFCVSYHMKGSYDILRQRQREKKIKKENCLNWIIYIFLWYFNYRFKKI